MKPTNSAALAAYHAALEAFRAVSRAHATASELHLAGRLSTAEYLEARQALELAGAAVDAAELPLLCK